MKLKLLPLLGGLVLAVALFGPRPAYAGRIGVDPQFAQVQPSTAPVCVSVSTSAWTAFPPITTANLKQRDGIFGIIQSTTTNDMIGLMAPDATRSTTPTTSVWDFRFFVANPTASIGIPDSMRLWLKSVHTSADTFCGREFIEK